MTIGLNMFHVILLKCDAIRALMEKTNFKEKMKSREHFFFHPNLLCCPQTSRKYIFSLNQAKAY